MKRTIIWLPILFGGTDISSIRHGSVLKKTICHWKHQLFLFLLYRKVSQSKCLCPCLLCYNTLQQRRGGGGRAGWEAWPCMSSVLLEREVTSQSQLTFKGGFLNNGGVLLFLSLSWCRNQRSWNLTNFYNLLGSVIDFPQDTR